MAGEDWDLISSYAGLLSLATFSVYAGSYGSLKAARKPKSEKPGVLVEDEDSDDDEDLPDRLSSSDAYLFPIIGSCALLGLYVVVKFLGTEWINYLLGLYFTVGGVGSIWKCSISLTRLAVGSERWKSYDKMKLLILKGPWEMLSFSLRTPSLVLLPFSAIPSIAYVLLPGPKRSAFLTDILALSFSHTALSVLKLDTFKTGCILLAGLFVYDIWWVFGTEVMVKVATSLDVPIKILWPKSMLFSAARGFTMLGLGDIVIPGMFVSLALRYDLSRASHKDPKQAFSKPFFTSAITAYALGLITTMTIMHTFGAAQPALLYLSPACILSFFITGLSRGDLKEAWEFTDEPDTPKDEAVTGSKCETNKFKEPVVSTQSKEPKVVEAHIEEVQEDTTAGFPHPPRPKIDEIADEDEGESSSGPKHNRRRGKKKRTRQD